MMDAVGQDILSGDKVAYMGYGGKGGLKVGYVHHLTPKMAAVASSPTGGYLRTVDPKRLVVVRE